MTCAQTSRSFHYRLNQLSPSSPFPIHNTSLVSSQSRTRLWNSVAYGPQPFSSTLTFTFVTILTVCVQALHFEKHMYPPSLVLQTSWIMCDSINHNIAYGHEVCLLKEIMSYPPLSKKKEGLSFLKMKNVYLEQFQHRNNSGYVYITPSWSKHQLVQGCIIQIYNCEHCTSGFPKSSQRPLRGDAGVNSFWSTHFQMV